MIIQGLKIKIFEGLMEGTVLYVYEKKRWLGIIPYWKLKYGKRTTWDYDYLKQLEVVDKTLLRGILTKELFNFLNRRL